ncbi:MAG: hypothetical protein ACYCPW_05590 [Nitrososphaerales archaeon]
MNSDLPAKPRYKIDPEIKIVRNIGSGTFRFKDIFVGFDELEILKKVFGKNVSKVLDALTVEVFPKEGYMGVSDHDGHIFVSHTYLDEGDEWSIYLDIVHELVHVRQFKEGKDLFDPKYDYVDRPTEIEAYQVGTEEARRIGLTDEEIFSYLEVPWISREEHHRLARACRLEIELE